MEERVCPGSPAPAQAGSSRVSSELAAETATLADELLPLAPRFQPVSPDILKPVYPPCPILCPPSEWALQG